MSFLKRKEIDDIRVAVNLETRSALWDYLGAERPL